MCSSFLLAERTLLLVGERTEDRERTGEEGPSTEPDFVLDQRQP
jgi:hypothetical protein